MHAARLGDLAQGIARYVAGQDDGRYFTTQRLAQPGDDLGAGQVPRQIVVGVDAIRQQCPSRRQCERLVCAGEGGCPVSLSLEQYREHLAYLGIVFDDQDRAGGARDRHPLRSAWQPLLVLSERHLYGEDRPAVRPGADIDGVAQEIANALHDGKTQAETAVALAGWVVELMEFLEDRLQLSRGNAYPGVPHLDAQLVAAPAGAAQDLASLGIFYGVRQQVSERLLEQPRIATHVQSA